MGFSRSSEQRAPVTLVADSVTLEYRVRADAEKPGPLRLKSTEIVRAVSNVSFVARKGEMIGVLGRNGSGKSSLLRLLAGVEPPTSGSILANSQPQLLGVSAALIATLSGIENIQLGTMALGLTKEQAVAATEEVAALADIGDEIYEPVRTYSAGMSSRLRFAISVIARPEILLIDEALSTGDASFMERARAALNSMLSVSGTVFLVSHSPQTIERMCNRSLWMMDGELIADGPGVEVAKQYQRFGRALGMGKPEYARRIAGEASKVFKPEFSPISK